MCEQSTEFETAYVARDLETCRRLLAANQDLLDYPKPPYTYIHRAAQDGWVDFLALISDLGIPLNFVVHERTPLFFAGCAVQVEAVRFLFEHGCPANHVAYVSVSELAGIMRWWIERLKSHDSKFRVSGGMVVILELFFMNGEMIPSSNTYDYQYSPIYLGGQLELVAPGFTTARIRSVLAQAQERQQQAVEAAKASYAEAQKRRLRKEKETKARKEREAREQKERQLKDHHEWVRWNHRFADLIEAAPKAHRNSLLAVNQIAYLEFSTRKKLPEKSPEEMMKAVLAELEGCDGQH